MSQTHLPATQPGPEIATEVLPPINPIQAFKPLLNPHGEIELATMQMGERLQAFMEIVSKSNCNLPLWEANIFTQFYAGTTFLPIPITPGTADAWRGADASNMGLRAGEVEPKADFIIKLASILDIKLVEVFSGINNDTGVSMYSVRYNAFLTLANGATLSVTNEGKDQQLLKRTTNQNTGVITETLTAHVVENTRKKAKRNAVKALLGLPTAMLATDFDRPWILLRPVFHLGQSDETDAIIASQKTIVNESQKLLYSSRCEERSQIDALKDKIMAVQSYTDLAQLKSQLETTPMTSAQRKDVGDIFNSQVARFNTGEVKY